MLIKTEGLVLGFIRYSETSIIVRIFTKELGTQSYIVNGVRKSQNKQNPIALFQLLTLLEMVVYDKKNTDLHRFKEVKVLMPYLQIPFERKKTVIAIFLSEILSKLLLHETQNPLFFDFLKESFLFFDQQHENYENFHLQFLLKMSNYTGFSIQSAEQLAQQLSQDYLDIEILKIIDKLLLSSYNDFVPLSGQRRSQILEMLIRFYTLHHENFKINSLEIIRTIFYN